jgi:hypothetical protein
MNVPFVSNGLSPLTLSNVTTSDLLIALRGVWEFGPELLADARIANRVVVRWRR